MTERTEAPPTKWRPRRGAYGRDRTSRREAPVELRKKQVWPPVGAWRGRSAWLVFEDESGVIRPVGTMRGVLRRRGAPLSSGGRGRERCRASPHGWY